ncbi:hypothetical protein SCHPADRAFT_924919 [Schizopora paradoxa]|uniref:Uncharacterized protein n=1 Tax=Schizopora paradoxa TaxID=27342 RepID=A0A0H2S3U6_9AGAM|nr:hypothetical protein SCHPADRAFT_924919 [Schizopora paradoxa]
MKASVLESLGAFKYLGNRKEKGKQPASNHAITAAQSHPGYGSSAQTQRSGDVLERVEEVWDSEHSGEEENWNDAEDGFVRDIFAYRRTYRLFAIVPFFSVLLFVVLALLPTMIWPRKSWQPQQDSPRLFSSFLLSAALWSLSYVLRVPLHNAVSFVLTKVFAFLYRLAPSLCNGLDTTVTSIHAILFVILQELLRLSSFVILSLHWHQVPSSLAKLDEAHFYAKDAVFREVWFIGLAWAAAEVGAGIAQGYENLALYDEEALFGVTEVYEDDFGNGIKLGSPTRNNDVEERPASKSSIDRLLDCRPCAPSELSERSIDLDNAITQLTYVKAREDLEDVFGMPFIDVPVFVTLLQRVDSYILSMALTLLLALAYLPPPPYASSMSIHLWPTFFATTAIHAILALLHTPFVLTKVGLPAVAYIACLVSLGNLFGAIGLWVGLWG